MQEMIQLFVLEQMGFFMQLEQGIINGHQFHPDLIQFKVAQLLVRQFQHHIFY